MTDEKKPFSDRRWTEPPAYEVIGHSELTEAQKESAAKFMELLRSKGYIKDESSE